MSEARQRPAQADPYDRLAPFYDQVMAGFDADLELYAALARAAAGPVLELGAGTGRVALELSALGSTVVGLDRSREMLSRAAGPGRAKRRPALVQGDMRRPPLRGPFGLVICARDTFLHLESRAEQLQCLRAVRDLLTADGSFVLDLPGPAGELSDWDPGARAPVLDWTRSVDGFRLSRFVSFTADLAEQVHDVTDIHERIEADGLVRRTVVEYRLRFCFPEELLLLLEAAGLRCSHRYGGYDLEPFNAASERMIVFARAATV